MADDANATATAAATTDADTQAQTTATAEPGKTEAAATTTAASTEAKAAPARGWRDPAAYDAYGEEGKDLFEFSKRIASDTDMVKVLYDLRKSNSSMIKLPGKDAKPEDVAKYRKAIGAAEKVEEYKFAGAAEAGDTDKAIYGKIAETLFKHNAPPALASELEGIVAEVKQTVVAEQERVAKKGREDNEAALRKKWGADYDANVQLASRAAKAFGGEEFLDFMANNYVNGVKIGDIPLIHDVFGQIGRRMGEGQFIGTVGTEAVTTLKDELAQIMRDNPTTSEKYKQPHIQKRIREINQQLYPSKSA